MIELQKNIRGLKQIVNRKRKINPETDTTALEKEIEAHQNSYNGYVEKYGEPKPKVKKIKIELPKIE